MGDITIVNGLKEYGFKRLKGWGWNNYSFMGSQEFDISIVHGFIDQ